MRNLDLKLLCFILLIINGCKSKCESAFEEFEEREYYSSPSKGEESLEEIELLSNVINFKPEISAVYFYRAEQYELFEEYEKAIEDYKTCIKQDWVFGNLYYQKGMCELELRNFEIANGDFETAKKLIKNEWNQLGDEDKRPNQWEDPINEHQEMLKELEEKINYTKSRMK